jgi:hypothetical protein
MKTKLSFFFLLLLFVRSVKQADAQINIDKNADWYIEAGLRRGTYVPYVPRHAYIKEMPQYGIDLRLGKQTDGSNEWEQWFNYPAYGILLRYEHNSIDSARYIHRLSNDQIATDWVSIGDCYTVGGFINGHVFKAKHWSFDYDLIGGFSFWTRYGNEFIGSLMNVHLGIDAGPTMRISDRMDLLGRVIFSHSSNGALMLPNNGVNVLSYELGMRYHLNERPKPIHIDSLAWHKKTSLFISDAPGLLQTETNLEGQIPGEGGYYFCNNFRIGIARQFHPKYAYNVGLDFNWTGETKVKYQQAHEKAEAGNLEVPLEEYTPWKSTHIAISAMFEIIYNRFSFCMGGAYYLYHGIFEGTDEEKTWTIAERNMSIFERQYLPNAYKNYYERLGFKYYFGKNRNQFIGAFMKAHMDSIDFIEWTYGINFLNWKSSKTHYKR